MILSTCSLFIFKTESFFFYNFRRDSPFLEHKKYVYKQTFYKDIYPCYVISTTLILIMCLKFQYKSFFLFTKKVLFSFDKRKYVDYFVYLFNTIMRLLTFFWYKIYFIFTSNTTQIYNYFLPIETHYHIL